MLYSVILLFIFISITYIIKVSIYIVQSISLSFRLPFASLLRLKLNPDDLFPPINPD
jgi:hypothetical protein